MFIKMTATLSNIVKFLIDFPFFIYLLVFSIFESLNRFVRQRKKSLEGETILVTGAAVGLGRLGVLEFAKEAAGRVTLVLWDINETALCETAEECRNLGAKVYTYKVDLASQQNIATAAEKVRQEVGDITMLWNNAGVVVHVPFVDCDPALMEKVIQVNLLSPMWTTREFLPAMVRQGKGHVICTCSGLGLLRWRMLSSYCASKFGMRGFMETLKLEMSQYPQIKCTTLYLSWTKTSMIEGLTWKPRYQMDLLVPMEPEYVAQKLVEGILLEKDDVMVPDVVNLCPLAGTILPRRFMERVENYLYQNVDHSKRDISQIPPTKTTPVANSQQKPIANNNVPKNRKMGLTE